MKYYDRVVGDVYSEFFVFTFKCELLNIANDKIRVHYWVPVTDDSFKSVFTNDLKPDLVPTYNSSTVFFWRSTGFSAQILNEFDPDLDGLKTWYTLFHTKIAKTNLTAFANWNFSARTDSNWWDSIDNGFWFDKDTTMLVQTVPYYIK